MPTGDKSGYAGGAVPLLGQAEVRGQSSGEDIMTITGPTSMTSNRYLNLRSASSEGEQSTAQDLWWISSAGGIGPHRRQTLTLTTASTAATLTSTDFGGIIYLTGGGDESYTITLPTVGSTTKGGYYMVVNARTNSSNADKFFCADSIFSCAAHDYAYTATAADGKGTVWEWFSDGTYWYGYLHSLGSTTTQAGRTYDS